MTFPNASMLRLLLDPCDSDSRHVRISWSGSSYSHFFLYMKHNAMSDSRYSLSTQYLRTIGLITSVEKTVKKTLLALDEKSRQ